MPEPRLVMARRTGLRQWLGDVGVLYLLAAGVAIAVLLSLGRSHAPSLPELPAPTRVQAAPGPFPVR